MRLRNLLPHIDPLPAGPTGPERYLGLAGLGAIIGIYCVVMLRYLFTLHAAFGTHAEDMGIMDQALWNTAHGHFLQQTICNPISDNNCLGNASRWAIHFEPLLLALVPIYWLAPGVGTLIVVQVVGVALGALPAYWLGSRRLGSVWCGWIAAAAYLGMPVLRAVVLGDFHMVALAAPLLLFALYYLYDRNDRGLLITCLLAMGTKEQIPLDVWMIGIAALLFQGRWRIGLWLMGLATGWALLAQLVIHLSSPLGMSPTAARYGGVSEALHRLPLLLRDPYRRHYLWQLISNTGGLGILVPWVLLLAVPTVLVNALSADPNQYSGLFQYNADIAPFLLVAGIEGFALLARGIGWLANYSGKLARRIPVARDYTRLAVEIALLALVVVNANHAFINAPDNKTLNPTRTDAWPMVTAHDKLATQFYSLIPPNAALSVQSGLAPHLSERQYVYQFPDHAATAAYVFLDMTGDYYPEPHEAPYLQQVNALLQSGHVTVVKAADGYILLRHAAQAVGPVTLPPSFCPTNPVANGLLLQGILQVGHCAAGTGADG